MNRLSIRIMVMISAITVLAIAGGIALSFQWYWPAFICLLIIIYMASRLYKLNLKTVNQFKIFTQSIKFSDNNISFTNTLSDDVYIDYYNNLHNAIERLNTLTQKRESEISFYTTLLNRIDFALIVTDDKNEIVWINKIALDMIGRPKPKNINLLKDVSEELAETLITLQPKTTKTIKLTKDGKTKNMAVTLSLITVRNNNLKIYGLKDVQPVIEETEYIAWQQLISVLTHEMMNSLTPIISLSDTFSDKESEYDNETMIKAMTTIHRRSEGLINFINNYKKLTQIPAPQKEVFSVKQLIEDVVNLLSTKELKIKYIITSDQLMINADRGQMEHVLINLIKNAWEAIGNRHEPCIKISVMKDNTGTTIISVSDNGCGIDTEKIDKIFMPFYTTKSNGSGIGLSICRQMINLHGGTITVSSQPELGSNFTIRLG